MKRFKSVEEYIDSLDQWHDEVVKLREILKSTDLTEEVKWGLPAYTFNGKNVAGIAAFKEHFALWFFQGALLKDTDGVLVNCQDGKTKAMRQWRMTSKKEIKVRTIKAYVKESIANFAGGKEIKADRNKPVLVPKELESALKKNKKAWSKFESLTIGKKREFADHVSDAKRAETKQKRIEKILPMILDGVGLNDKYRNC